MRQGQFKNRSRNRGRRPSSPLSRVYESNGPDVKVRGTAQHVAEKYLQLARDAMSSGDTVMGESYFQHAEHYLRIVAAAQSFQQQHGFQPNQQRRPDEEAFDEGEDMTGDDHAPQPSFSEQPSVDMDADTQPEPAPAPQQAQPRGQQAGGEGRRNWDGHQPDFLKRSSPGANGGNGTGRSRRGRGRGNQNQQASETPAEASDPEAAPEQVG